MLIKILSVSYIITEDIDYIPGWDSPWNHTQYAKTMEI